MAVIERDISAKPVTMASVLDFINRELIPCVRAIRAAVNRELRATSTTVGDGVTLVYDVTHPLGSEDVIVTVYDLGTLTDKVAGTDYTVERLDTSTVRVTYAVAPTSDRVLIRV